MATRIIELQDNLIQAREEFRLRAVKDALTGPWNRGAFLELLARELDRATRAKSQTGLMFLDLDHFKKVNDIGGNVAQLAASRNPQGLVALILIAPAGDSNR